jgi:hypothetical protein
LDGRVVAWSATPEAAGHTDFQGWLVPGMLLELVVQSWVLLVELLFGLGSEASSQAWRWVTAWLSYR